MIEEEQKATAKIIFEQYGAGEFAIVTGAKNLKYLKDGGLIFEIGRNKKSVKWVETKLNGNDLYDVRFFNRKGEVLTEVKDIFNDQLKDIFQQNTYLYVSLLPKEYETKINYNI
jgi:hypothetical protein